MCDTSKKIAIYGGSFSPVHYGHIKAARAYLTASEADKIIIIPAKKPPHKSLDGSASDIDRINMCKLAFSQDDELRLRFEVSDYEISRDRISYTIDTVEHFRSLGYGDISILIGTDMLLTFESWCRFRELFEYVSVYYIDRYDEKKELTEQKAEEFRQKYGAKIYAIHAPVFEASSSEVRRLICEGKSTDGIIPDCVREYIDKNGLYK